MEPTKINNNSPDQLRIITLGEVLFDHFPENRRLGGAPFNFAVHLHSLGLKVDFLSRIGSDPEGEEIRSYMAKRSMPMDYLQQDKSHPTGMVKVTPLGNKSHSFEILKDMAYDYIDFSKAPAPLNASLIYFGTLIQRTEKTFKALNAYLESAHDEACLMCDINLRPGCYTRKTVLASLEHADILKINDQEIIEIASMISVKKDISSAIDALLNSWDISMIALTEGHMGSRIITHKHECTTPALIPESIQDTVGAGDAYAAVLALGYLMNWTSDNILQKAAAFASKICTIEGALPDDPGFYDELKKIE